MALASSLLSIGTRVHKTHCELIATTAWRLRLLTLGWLYRKVVVNQEQMHLTIDNRYLWIFRRRRQIPFQDIEAVTYGYDDAGVGSGWAAQDSMDIYSVGLRLRSGKELHLFHFFGEGTFTNNSTLWPDWMYWSQHLFDASGKQESESRTFVSQLCKMINVTLVPPRTW